MTAISTIVQSLSPGQMVHLYSLDTTTLGGAVYNFTSGPSSTGIIRFAGVDYYPVDLEATGFEWDGKGALPQPKIKVSNAAHFMGAATITLKDLVGATLTRTRTYAQFLDGQPGADPTAIHPTDVYRVNRKANYNKIFIEWELASVLDQEGRKLPGRQIIKHNCTHIYRFWNGTTFDYTKATCPYTGTPNFDISDNPISGGANDVCGKLLSSCRARFGLTSELPFRGFPGSGETAQ